MADPIVESPEVAETRKVDYTFSNDIMVVRNVIQWGRDLIEAAEQLGKWKRADVVDAAVGSYDSDRRSNSLLSVYHGDYPEMLDYEAGCKRAFHTCAAAYKAVNPWCPALHDTGYQLLRYAPGQQFKLHFDQIPKSRRMSARMLSAVAFLNDDFDGGELVFPRQKRVIQPEAGTIVLFPSGWTHPHASQIVGRGVKYSVVCWFIA